MSGPHAEVRARCAPPHPTPSLVGRAYDARALEYVELFGDVDRVAAPDRALVARWRDSTSGPLLDAGCGPGQWTGFLGAAGRPVLGLDVSERFLAHAQRTRPAIPFVRGSIDLLPLHDASVGGILAWYSLIHLRPDALPSALVELRRVLQPAGSVLVGFFEGAAGEPFPHAVTTAYFWSLDALGELLAAAGLVVVEHHHRTEERQRPLAALVATAGPLPAPP